LIGTSLRAGAISKSGNAIADATIENLIKAVVGNMHSFLLRSPGIYAWDLGTQSPWSARFSGLPSPALALVALPFIFIHFDPLQNLGHMPNAMMFLMVVDVAANVLNFALADRQDAISGLPLQFELWFDLVVDAICGRALHLSDEFAHGDGRR
jgi:hypothetical protein